MNYETILVEKKDGIAVITLNRPEKLNAVNGKMRQEVVEVLDDLERDDAIRVVIFTGAGRGFCAGADISEFAESDKDASVQGKINKGMLMMARHIYDFEKPVIGAINGVSAGDGSQWALAFDLNIASEKARFGWPATALGIL
ncbi:MAG: enoyl-CoA hydratase/isomerase family protein [Deltaproteobacteria bacterium]|nr:enoyl-CoA hydratase/isomerase family protein [Deltaproteobacteria bacterium]